MKLRTVLQLQEYLDNEYAWRVKEIDYAQTAVRRASGSAQVTLTRAGVALLYAHWEGFVKCAAEALLNFIVCRSLKYKDLQSCFIAHGMAHHLELLSSSLKHNRRSESVQFILNNLDSRAKFPWANIISTHGNLSADVFNNIAAAIAIDSTKYEPRRNWIDKELLANRNKIAHGERLSIQPDQFPTLASETLTLLRWFKTDIENSIVLKTYLAKTYRSAKGTAL